MIIILIFILSLIPAALVYFWLKRAKKDDVEYKRLCKDAFIKGAVWTILYVFLLSTILYIFEFILSKINVNVYIRVFYHNFIIFAFSEELVKFYMLRKLMKKNSYPYTSLDIISFMMLIGLGFEVSESIVYAVGANAPTILTRAFTMMHCGYGFIMGVFVAKGRETGKKIWFVLGILIPFLLHGTYDFCLSSELGKISDKIIYVSLFLALFAIFTMIVAIIYINVKRKR